MRLLKVFRRGPSLLPCLVVVVLLSLIPLEVQATVYTHNETGRVAAYPSLPALFGEPFLDGRMYEGVLQYLVENPFLCEPIDWNTTSFVNGSSSSMTQEYRPVALLAARGNCPFHYKAMVAESLSPRVEFLIIYNHNLDGEDVLVPMYSEYGTSRLKLLSVTHRTGTALKHYIIDAPNSEKIAGTGPVLFMDSLPPEGVMTAQDLQDVLVSTLGLFFMLVSFSGCFLMCAAAAQHGHVHRRLVNQQHGGAAQSRSSPLWMLLMGDPDTDAVLVGDPARVGSGGGFSSGRSLLTTQEVAEYLTMNSGNNDDNGNETTSKVSAPGNNLLTNRPSGGGLQEAPPTSLPPSPSSPPPNCSHCAICIDDLDNASPLSILTLPCNHAFHADCIVPWLTERQSKCPLCKYDVFMHVQELAAQEPASSPRRQRIRNSASNSAGNFFSSSRNWFASFSSVARPSWMAVATRTPPEEEISDSNREIELTATHGNTGTVSTAATTTRNEPTVPQLS